MIAPAVSRLCRCTGGSDGCRPRIRGRARSGQGGSPRPEDNSPAASRRCPYLGDTVFGFYHYLGYTALTGQLLDRLGTVPTPSRVRGTGNRTRAAQDALDRRKDFSGAADLALWRHAVVAPRIDTLALACDCDDQPRRAAGLASFRGHSAGHVILGRIDHNLLIFQVVHNVGGGYRRGPVIRSACFMADRLQTEEGRCPMWAWHKRTRLAARSGGQNDWKNWLTDNGCSG